MEELRRARQDEIERANRWQLGGAYEAERKGIEEWLRVRVREATSAPNATLQSALAAGPTYAATIATVFARPDESTDSVLLAKARLGVLARESPSRLSLGTLMMMTVFATLLELAVFIAMWLHGEGDPMVVVNGGLLAAGGLFAGHGAGNLVGFLDEVGKRVRGGAANWGAVGTGAFVIAGIAVIRSSGGEEGSLLVILFTTIVAVLIAVLEALGASSRDKYRDRLEKMFLCQQWHATERHIDDAKNHYWERVYETEVRQLDKDKKLALQATSQSGV